jgi:threonyl-tRNA synthetase
MHGLIRLRQFTLAEGHIICRMDQLEKEFDDALALIKYVMDTLELKDFTYRFSKWDPENKSGKYIDNPKAWEESQKTLKGILDKHEFDYIEAEGEAAFYGPKLDIQMKNVFGKEDTLITVQIDFALPERFDMNYTDKDGKDVRPIVIHRSSIGCYERTMALLIEQYAGAFPLWLSPVQIKILPINDELVKYALEIKEKLAEKDIRVEIDDRTESLGKKIRTAEMEKVPYMIVIGEKEKEGNMISVRSKKDGDLGSLDIEKFVDKLLEEIKNKK